MKLKKLYLKNFRCYKEEIEIEFNQLTTIIGKNDIGKSTILEALEIFFNNDLVKIEATDANVNGSNTVEITCDFCDLPAKIILDSGEETTLQREYLTIADDLIRIKKSYDCSKSKVQEKVFIVANHPSMGMDSSLLSLKEKELQKIIKDRNINSTLKGNPSMRQAIWNSFPKLEIEETTIEISRIKEDGKEIWTKLSSYLPNFALFQSDRSSQDSDEEVQNPMKAAIQEALSEVQDEIAAIQDKVRDKAMKIAQETQEALKSIDIELAKQLTPKFSSPSSSKWNGLFSISMDTDNGIALNKRGSGVRRMVLVGFFKAEAERRLTSPENRKKNIIYALEEPETAQHPNNQKILVRAFKELAESEQRQVILTTHSPELARELPCECLRFIDRDNSGNPLIESGESIIPKIVAALGIYPDTSQNVKLILCLEGPTDVVALKALCRCLRTENPSLIDIENDERVLIVPLGGSTLKHWVSQRYFKNLKCPEVHIYDNDVKTYGKSIDQVNKRGDGSWGTLTNKHEIENYLHSDAIKALYKIDVDTDSEDLPKKFSDAYFSANRENQRAPWNDSTAKSKLSRVFEQTMTCKLLKERDPTGEVLGWFVKMSDALKRT